MPKKGLYTRFLEKDFDFAKSIVIIFHFFINVQAQGPIRFELKKFQNISCLCTFKSRKMPKIKKTRSLETKNFCQACNA